MTRDTDAAMEDGNLQKNTLNAKRHVNYQIAKQTDFKRLTS